MRLLDTDVMIDILREYPPAIDWLASLGDEELGLPGFVAMELMDGCRDKREMTKLHRLLQPFRILWPTEDDCNKALALFAKAHLSHGLGSLDALVAQCAIGLHSKLCTFNVKHFRAVPQLSTEQPYKKP